MSIITERSVGLGGGEACSLGFLVFCLLPSTEGRGQESVPDLEISKSHAFALSTFPSFLPPFL